VIVLVAGFAGTAIAEQNLTAGISSQSIFEIKVPGERPTGPPKNPLVGGETCATATAITALPYLDSGTTIGAINDYDAVCPYTGGTAGDVVYAYTPVADEAVDISVCSNGGDATYDTKIYVFEGLANCGVSDFACSDDDCTAPTYGSPYNSELIGLSLTAGNTYYIVIDGYGSDVGDYTLSVDVGVPPPPPPNCGDIGDAGFLLGQDAPGPDDDWSAATSTQASWASFPYLVAESIAQAADPDWFVINHINVWGMSLVNTGSWGACDPTGMTFDVIFYEDNAGVPGAVICDVQSAVPAITNTGEQYAGYDLFQFDIPAACDLGSLGSKWFSVQNEAMTPDCGFLWMSGTGGDSESLQDSDGTGFAPTGYDRGLCINGSTIPIELLSFDIE